MVILLTVGCTPAPSVPPDFETYVVEGGALQASVPARWGDPYAWRRSEPAGLGLLVEDPTRTEVVRFSLWASATALRDQPADRVRSDAATFQQVLYVADDLALRSIDSRDCTGAITRPINHGRWYGRNLIRRGCPDGETYERIVAIDAERTTLISIEGLAQPGAGGEEAVDLAFRSLVVDERALPISVPENVFTLIEG